MCPPGLGAQQVRIVEAHLERAIEGGPGRVRLTRPGVACRNVILAPRGPLVEFNRPTKGFTRGDPFPGMQQAEAFIEGELSIRGDARREVGIGPRRCTTAA